MACAAKTCTDESSCATACVENDANCQPNTGNNGCECKSGYTDGASGCTSSTSGGDANKDDVMTCTGSDEKTCTEGKTDYCIFDTACKCKDTSVTDTTKCPKVSSASPLAIAMICLMVCAILSAIVASVIVVKKKAVQRNNAQLIVSDVM